MQLALMCTGTGDLWSSLFCYTDNYSVENSKSTHCLWQACWSIGFPPWANQNKTMIKRSKSIGSHIDTFIRRERTYSEASRGTRLSFGDCSPPPSSLSPLHNSRGGKSGGGLVFQRLAKRFSKISRKGNSERRNEEKDRESGSAKERHSNAELSDTIDGGGGGEREKKAKSSKKLRPRSSSVSNLESVERYAHTRRSSLSCCQLTQYPPIQPSIKLTMFLVNECCNSAWLLVCTYM